MDSYGKLENLSRLLSKKIDLKKVELFEFIEI